LRVCLHEIAGVIEADNLGLLWGGLANGIFAEFWGGVVVHDLLNADGSGFQRGQPFHGIEGRDFF